MLPVCAEADRPNKKITASRTIPGRRIARKRFITGSPKVSLAFFPYILAVLASKQAAKHRWTDAV
jgi:hypothetical protein